MALRKGCSLYEVSILNTAMATIASSQYVEGLKAGQRTTRWKKKLARPGVPLQSASLARLDLFRQTLEMLVEFSSEGVRVLAAKFSNLLEAMS